MNVQINLLKNTLGVLQNILKCRSRSFVSAYSCSKVPVFQTRQASFISKTILSEGKVSNVQPNKVIRSNYCQKLNIESNINVLNNVFLYKNGSSSFQYIRIFAFLQMPCWLYLAYNIYNPSLLSFLNKDVALLQYFTNHGLHLLFFLWPFLAGTFIIMGCNIILTRNVQSIILHKHGNYVSLITYSLLKGTRRITYPVNNVCSVVARNQGKAYIPIKLKGRKFHYLVAADGNFVNETLYDSSIGHLKVW